jgi:hypothetical protein
MKCEGRGCHTDSELLHQLSGFGFPSEAQISDTWFCAKCFNRLLQKLEKQFNIDLDYLKEEE